MRYLIAAILLAITFSAVIPRPAEALSGRFTAAMDWDPTFQRPWKDKWVFAPGALPSQAVLARWGVTQDEWVDMDDPELRTKTRFVQRRAAFAAAAASDPVADYMMAYDRIDRAAPTQAALTAALLPMRAAAGRGNLRAMQYLWDFYWNGPEVTRHFEEGERWMKRAAEAGSPPAMEGMAFKHLQLWRDQSRMPTTDLQDWLRRASDGGSLNAMTFRAYVLQTFDAKPEDYAEALCLLERSAAGGNPMAFLGLSATYTNGVGVLKDYDRAAEYLVALRGMYPDIGEELDLEDTIAGLEAMGEAERAAAAAQGS